MKDTVIPHSAFHIAPDHVDLRVQVTQVMVAEEQDHVVYMLLLEVYDVEKFPVCLLGCNPFRWVWVQVVSQEDDVLVLSALDGLSPECPSMDVGYYDPILAHLSDFCSDIYK